MMPICLADPSLTRAVSERSESGLPQRAHEAGVLVAFQVGRTRGRTGLGPARARQNPCLQSARSRIGFKFEIRSQPDGSESASESCKHGLGHWNVTGRARLSSAQAATFRILPVTGTGHGSPEPAVRVICIQWQPRTANSLNTFSGSQG